MIGGRTYNAVVVYTLFTLAGIALVLPGALLPIFLAKFLLRDAQGGTLLFAAFLGSAAGALLARGRLPHSIARGAGITALGVFSLAYAEHLATLLAAILLYGLGLGITMTSASLFQARNNAANRSAELTRMNLLWSLGATAGPWLGLHTAERWSVSITLISVGCCFMLLGLLAIFTLEFQAEATNGSQHSAITRWTGLLLLVAIFLSTGIEAAAGGWLTTYAERIRGTLTFTVRAGTCFWAGILVSRFTQSVPKVAAASKRILLLLGPTLMISGLILLLFGNKAMISPGAFTLGLGIGPMYPLLLSYSLSAGEQRNLAFLIAGCGSSLLPFLTGEVSGAFGGLRNGLAVPLVGAVVMLLSNLAIRKDLAEKT